MAKPSAQPQASTSKAAAPPPTKSKAFEIDDIFASKPKPSSAKTTTTQPTTAPAPISSLPPTKSKKSKGKKKATEIENAAPVAAAAAEAPAEKVKVVEVVDPSAAIESYRPKRKAEGEEGNSKLDDDEVAFMDSRGTQRRRTDDGLAIYDASELKIGLGGETDECPFDCNCCF